jgi:ATP-binding protein involved in chromosome partitioning
MPSIPDILRALSAVQEPELRNDLVSLDMVKDVRAQGDEVTFKLELTTPACPLKDKIVKECEDAVKALPGVKRVSVAVGHRVLSSRPPGERSDLPGVKNVVAVYACKGGVGKSTVSSNLAAAWALDGCRVGLFDADIHGPNIPMMMGVTGNPSGEGKKLFPPSAHGVKLMSMGLMVDDASPMIWRGPMVHGAVKKLLRDTDWGDLDYLVVDLPPGTGDSQLTLIQTVPLAGVVVVTTPQDVALADGVKGIGMFRKLKVPILGLLENMSGFVCPNCSHETDVFGKGGGEKEAARLKIPYLGAVPLDPGIVRSGDKGVPVVVGAPASVSAKALRWAAQIVAGRISVANAGLEAPALPPVRS